MLSVVILTAVGAAASPSPSKENGLRLEQRALPATNKRHTKYLLYQTPNKRQQEQNKKKKKQDSEVNLSTLSKILNVPLQVAVVSLPEFHALVEAVVPEERGKRRRGQGSLLLHQAGELGFETPGLWTHTTPNRFLSGGF